MSRGIVATYGRNDYSGLIAGNGLSDKYLARLKDPRWQPLDHMPYAGNMDGCLDVIPKPQPTFVCPDCGGTFLRRASNGREQRCRACSDEHRLARQRKYDDKAANNAPVSG